MGIKVKEYYTTTNCHYVREWDTEPGLSLVLSLEH